MRIGFWGNGARGESCLAKTLASGFQVVTIIDQVRDVGGGTFKSLKEQAQEAGIPYHVLRSLRSQDTLNLLASYNPDLFVLAGYARLLPPELVRLPPMGAINTHAGRIPEYRGTAAIPWQIIRGESQLGLTVLYADEGVDTGDVLLSEFYELGLEEGATEATERATLRFPEMLVEVLVGLQNKTLKGVPQNLSAGAQYTRRGPEDGLIDSRFMTADMIFNMIRALRSPYPGAFGWVGHSKVILHRASILQENIYGAPGRIPLYRGNGVVMIAKDHGLLLTEVRSGDSIVPARDVLRVGDVLGPYPVPTDSIQ